MIRSLFYKDGKIRTDLKPAEWSAALADTDGLLWVDFEGNPPEKDEPLLREIFHFHPLAIDDALEESHVPKVDDWGDYLYVVLHAVAFKPGDEQGIDTQELDVFLGMNYIVTHHDEHIPAVERVHENVQRDERHLKEQADHLLYRLTDEVVASYMPVVDQIDEAVDDAEDQIFARPSSRTLEQIFMLKRAILHLRRIIDPQREVLNKLARDDYRVIDVRDRVYFRDVYDHLVRLHDIVESIRDLVGGALDTYLSVINNRMNDIMKTLTIITTLFMPLSFVTGFFGMNFFAPVARLENWTNYPMFYVTLALMLAIPAGMYLWMRSRGWMYSNE